MAIKDIVTVGYGSFSSVNKIPTRGFGSAPSVPGVEMRIIGDRLHWAISDNSLHYRQKNTSPEYVVNEV